MGAMSSAKLGGAPGGVKAAAPEDEGPQPWRGEPSSNAIRGRRYSSHPSTVNTAMATPIRLSPAMMPLETGTV